MSLSLEKIRKHYEGFLKTPFLWYGNHVFELYQFNIESTSEKIDIQIDATLRLGKYIERFVSYQLSQETNIKILAENIQIQEGKRTLGEIDCLLNKDDIPIHLEIIYKFYLYDESVGKTELDHFIGPNRRDSLLEKLTKLKEKQLPLLYSKNSKPILNELNVDINEISQQVYFKAQLFLPFLTRNIKLDHLKQECIVGYYITKKELNNFSDCKFYLPTKKDWLIIPHQQVKWISFKEFKLKSKHFFKEQIATLLWIKNQNGLIDKVFLVWW